MRGMTVSARQLLRIRLRDIIYPPGATRITFSLDSKTGKSWSMQLYATLLFLLPSLLKGIVSDAVMLAWIGFADLCTSALSTTATDTSVLELETLAR